MDSYEGLWEPLKMVLSWVSRGPGAHSASSVGTLHGLIQSLAISVPLPNLNIKPSGQRCFDGLMNTQLKQKA